MTPKERAAMQQALEALHAELEAGTCEEFENAAEKCYEAITALREALAEQAEQEPVAWRVLGEDGESLSDWIDGKPGEDQDQWESTRGNTIQRAYTRPVRTKDLTDDEIEAAVLSVNTTMEAWITYRAVIAADREKNNANNNT